MLGGDALGVERAEEGLEEVGCRIVTGSQVSVGSNTIGHSSESLVEDDLEVSLSLKFIQGQQNDIRAQLVWQFCSLSISRYRVSHSFWSLSIPDRY